LLEIDKMTAKIAFQGELGAYSHQACSEMHPELEALPCKTFEDAIDAVRSGVAELAMLPVENSTYGRVPDMHSLLPESGLHIVGEAFVRVRINLMGVAGAKIADVKTAMSHAVLLGQCRGFLTENGLVAVAWGDTAGAALHVAELQDKSVAALGTALAGQIYGLEDLAENIEDNSHNATRFVIMSRNANTVRDPDAKMMTSFVFRVRNIPAALYKAMGGFATNGVNMVKLESYMVDGSFTATQFFAEIDGHPDDANVRLALDELGYFTEHVKVLGVFPKGPGRP
jgi:prephenate dehydratase